MENVPWEAGAGFGDKEGACDLPAGVSSVTIGDPEVEAMGSDIMLVGGVGSPAKDRRCQKMDGGHVPHPSPRFWPKPSPKGGEFPSQENGAGHVFDTCRAKMGNFTGIKGLHKKHKHTKFVEF